MLIVVLLLAWAYRRAAMPETRRQVGLVALGGAVGLLPFLTFSLLPEALLRQPLLPYEFSFLFLLTIPLAYGYAILRYRLMHLDRYISHGAASALVLTLLGSLYLALNAVLVPRLPSELWQPPVVNLVIVLLMAAAFGPLHRRLQVVVNRLFYGGWYDYRTAVQQVSWMLDKPADSAALAQSLSEGIQQVMQLECACLLLPDQNGNLSMSGVACQTCGVNPPSQLRLEADGLVRQYFRTHPLPVEADVLRENLPGVRLSDAESRLLACGRARLWLPISGCDHSLGMLLLGAKRGGEDFDMDDLAILGVVARQAGLAFQNLQLIAELRQQIREGERLHREIVRAREAERTHVARELHDQIIQTLIGLNYHLSDLRTRRGVDFDGAPAHLQEECGASVATCDRRSWTAWG